MKEEGGTTVNIQKIRNQEFGYMGRNNMGKSRWVEGVRRKTKRMLDRKKKEDKLSNIFKLG